jgi:HlyD family secretion protein
MIEKKGKARRSLRRHVVGGAAVLFLAAGGVGGWTAATEVSGAVVAPGVLVVDSNVKKVQHLSGGVVKELLVRDGDRVRAGDVVVRLDETVTRANLAIVVKGLDELAARQARLEAERDGTQDIPFPESLTRRAGDPDVDRIIISEGKLFEFRKIARQGQKSQLKERVAQLNEEIGGLAGQAAAKKQEIALILQELEGVRELWKKNLVQLTRLIQLERESVRLEGERNQLIASSAQAKGKITETELQSIQIDQDLRSEVSKELREIQGKVAELVERKVAAEDQLTRLDIRAPQDGMVHQLAAHTVGGVITASEAIMLIVPEQDELEAEAKLPPHDIDQLRVGQKTILRFSAFNQRTTPEIGGLLKRISGDITQDQRTGTSYYLVRVSIPSAEVAKLEGLKLVPGMPVDAFIQTDPRTIMSYLVKPLRDQIAKAFRER